MYIEIGGKEYPLDFGGGFLDYIDEVKGRELKTGQLVGGDKFYGFELTYNILVSGKDPRVLTSVLKGALCTLKSLPSNADLQEFVDTLALAELKEYEEKGEDGEQPYSEFVDQVTSEIKKQPQAGIRILNFARLNKKA